MERMERMEHIERSATVSAEGGQAASAVRFIKRIKEPRQTGADKSVDASGRRLRLSGLGWRRRERRIGGHWGAYGWKKREKAQEREGAH